MTRNLNFFGKFSLFFLFFLSFQFVHCESEFKGLPGKRFKTQKEMETYLNKTDLAVLAFFYKKESDKSIEIAKNLKIVYSKLQYLVEYILVDCDKSKMEQCKLTDEDFEDTFYRIEMYMPPELKFNPYTKELNPHQKVQYMKTDVSDKALYKFLTKIIISREERLTNENFERFIQRIDINKVLLFTNKITSPLMFRGLSGYFYDRLAFGFVTDVEKEICEKYNITKFPTIMIIQTLEDDDILDEPKEIIYKGELTVKPIVKFLKKYALKEKLYLKKREKDDDENSIIFFFNLTAEDAKKFFKKKRDKDVILYFDNKIKNGNISYDYLSEDIKEFNKETHGFFIFGYVDCTGEEKGKLCNSYFKIKEFPKLILYKPQKDIKEKIEKGIELPKDLENIKKEINSLYEPNIKIATASSFQKLVSDTASNSKISLLYLHEGNIGLGFKLLTNKEMFKELFEYITFENPSPELKKHLQVSKLPYISLIIPDEEETDNYGNPQMKMMIYKGKFTYSDIFSFLTGSFAPINNIFDSDNSTSSSEEEDDNIPVEISFIQKTDDLVKTCTQNKFCVIGFFDMRANEESQKKFNESFEIFKNFTEVSKNEPISFGYINATCQKEFTSKFNVNLKSIPSIIIYSYRKGVYSNLLGKFNVDNMNELISKTLSEKIKFKKIKKNNAILQEIKCETIQSNSEDDENDNSKDKNTDL